MPHVPEQGLRSGRLDDPPGVHDHHPAGPARDHAHVVRDEQHPHAEPLFKIIEECEDLRLDRYVEGRCRLVGDDQLRFAGQGHRDHRALAETARQLMRESLQALERLRHADQVQHLRGPFQRLLL